MPTLTQGRNTGEFIQSEGNGNISREVGTLAAAAAALVPGTLLGKLTTGGKLVAYSNAASDGSQTCIGVLYAAAADLAADQKVVYVARLAEVKRAELTGLDAAAEVELNALNIFVR